MKLYFSPGACSLSPHLVLNELGLPHQLVKVDLKAKTTADGRDFRTINPKGYVPTLELDDGSILTEGPAIVQYLADRKPDAHLAPANGTMARYRLQEWLNFISTELHKQFSPLFNPATPADMAQMQKTRLHDRFAFVAQTLAKHDWLLPEGFSVADCYLYTVLTWAPHVGVDVSDLPALAAFKSRMEARPAVAKTLEVERNAKKG